MLVLQVTRISSIEHDLNTHPSAIYLGLKQHPATFRFRQRVPKRCKPSYTGILSVSASATKARTWSGEAAGEKRGTRSSALPMNLVARRMGHQRLNSFIQLCSVDFGTIIMCGPVIWRYSCR